MCATVGHAKLDTSCLHNGGRPVLSLLKEPEQVRPQKVGFSSSLRGRIYAGITVSTYFSKARPILVVWTTGTPPYIRKKIFFR